MNQNSHDANQAWTRQERFVRMPARHATGAAQQHVHAHVFGQVLNGSIPLGNPTSLSPSQDFMGAT